MNPKKLLVVLFSLFIISWPSFVDARSGCCSHHGGVCGCGCCDGSDLSATCAPYYPECGSSDDSSDYVPLTFDEAVGQSDPTPTKSLFPNPLTDVVIEYFVNKQSNGKFSVTFDWADTDKYLNHDYSVKLAKYAMDPGPLVDTSRSTITITDVDPGEYVLSMKTKTIGSWTNDYIYWDNLDISDKTANSVKANSVSYTKQQLPKEQEIIKSLEDKVNNFNNESAKIESSRDTNHTWAVWASIIAAGLAWALYSKSEEFDKLSVKHRLLSEQIRTLEETLETKQ